MTTDASSRNPTAAPEGVPLDVLAVGGGPAGLAVAIAAKKEGLAALIVEKGALVNSIVHFPSGMTFFTTPDLLEIGGLPFVTPYEKPTRGEALRYYRRVVDTYALDVAFDERVESIRREGDGFIVTSRCLAPAHAGAHRRRLARHVVFATGYYDQPNRLGIPGEDLPHVSHYYDDPHPFFRKRVVVVGGKNSAAIAALELYRAGASVTLVHRRPALSDSIKYWIRPDIENRIKEGSVKALLETTVREIHDDRVVIDGPSGARELPADAVLLLTGYLPDTSLLCEAGVSVDAESLRPAHDPQTFETNVRGLFVAGSIVSGRDTNRTFIENGRFHGAAIVEAIRTRGAALAGGAAS
jgi:bacillithiol disulfide reductase